MKNILIVEYSATYRELLCKVLKGKGYKVKGVGSVKSALNEIKKESVMLAALAVESYPAKIENGILYIKFPNDQKFHSEQILLPEKKPKVEKIINTLCNTDVTIQTLLEDESSQNQEDKFLQKAINFFDGEILERK